MQGKLKLAEKMGEVLCFIKMEINMMVNGRITIKLVKEFICKD
jgi:hypothetical protein